ncbi:glycosyltransferase [Dactylosporangium vinaceum]|uniref:Glycosyltransferase n=1 Tax=Dactylosporangium vinaceum TaxID=53362 RepID=A0ABV5M2C4_9ACTN|nr:glycosyltransferase [Dactylosporangium vinaceum]UAB99429.1 glycosyltransferase [Dactylosporangium vinaceum]
MKIVQLANFYTPVSGGLRTCVEQTGRGYIAAGHERVTLVPGTEDRDITFPDGRHLTVRSPLLPGSGGYRVLTARARVCALLDKVEPDVLEANDKLSIAWLSPWARRRGVPLVLVSHERINAILRTRVPRWFPLDSAATAANRRLHRLVDHIVLASAFSAAEFEVFGREKTHRVPLGVDLDTFRPAPAKAPHPERDDVRLVTVTRLSTEKHPELSIAALRELRRRGIPASLDVIGTGPLQRRLAKVADDLPVRFLGHVAERNRLAELVAAADVSLSPSPAETFGLATLESLACGVPVVVPSEGAARELIMKPESGRVTDGTPQGLADGVESLLAAPAERRQADARAVAEQFPWSATVNGLLDVYATATNRERVPQRERQ